MIPELKLGRNKKRNLVFCMMTAQVRSAKGRLMSTTPNLRVHSANFCPAIFVDVLPIHRANLSFFHADHMYEDDPDRFLIFVEVLGSTKARLHFVLDGVVVEQTVYKRVKGVGLNPYDAFESDLDMFIFFSENHAERRRKWPDIFQSHA